MWVQQAEGNKHITIESLIGWKKFSNPELEIRETTLFTVAREFNSSFTKLILNIDMSFH